jgi:hypothetical protein
MPKFKLKPSKKKTGDLVVFQDTDNGTLIVIIDKENPNFINAQAGEIWEVNVRTKEGESFGLGDLVRKIEIKTSVEHLNKDQIQRVGLVVRDAQTKEVLMHIPFGQSQRLTGMAIVFVKNIIGQYHMEHFTDQLLEACKEGMDWFCDKTDKVFHIADEALELLKLAPRPELFQEDFEVEFVHEETLRAELMKLINPFSLPNPEDIADEVMTNFSCWFTEKEGFKKINFV